MYIANSYMAIYEQVNIGALGKSILPQLDDDVCGLMKNSNYLNKYFNKLSSQPGIDESFIKGIKAC